jgi:alpha-mannosidase
MVAEPQNALTTIHFVPHTHWDREWYEPFQVFRLRLVQLVDRVLDMLERNPQYRFTLDGQLATVDDYLEVRPEAEPAIRRFVAEGRLAIGPWQILMDEFLVSGETIVRNLQRGWSRGQDLGGAMEVGYLPDMFGHIAQMPQILRRSGIREAVVWRGVPAAVSSNRFRWRGLDGSEVDTEYLVGGYGNAAHLLTEPDQVASKVRAYLDLMGSFYGDRSLLAMSGTDHMAPLAETVSLIEAANEVHSDVQVRIETLPEYLESRDRTHDADFRVEGELRSASRANLLPGVTSTHLDIRAAAARAERALTRYAEPLLALYAADWPARLVDLAWQRVIDNSAHDSICACSVDPVAAQVLVRFAEAEQIARGLAQRVLAGVGGGASRDTWLCMNPSAYERSGLVTLTVPVPEDWDGVAFALAGGDRIATQEMSRNKSLLHEAEMSAHELMAYVRRVLRSRDLLGKSINGATVDGSADPPSLTFHLDDEAHPEWLDLAHLATELEVAVGARLDEPWLLRALAVPRRTLRAMVPAPALGWTGLRPERGDGALVEAVSATDRRLDNGRIRVTVADDGTLHLEADGVSVTGAGRLLDGGDAGDSYNYAPPPNDLLVEQPLEVSTELLADGPVVAEIVVRRTYDWPVGLADALAERTEQVARTAVDMHVELRSGEPFVRLRLEFDNPATDHRLRCHVPLPRTAEHSAAEGQFAVVQRGMTVEGGYGEVPLPTYPAYGFIDAGGVAILLEHVTEYELLDGRELALTCLRSIGLISRDEHPYRAVPAGPESPMPGAQLLGAQSISFALYPHQGSWHEADLNNVAELYAHDFLATRGTSGETPDGTTPAGQSGLTVTGRGVVMTALYRRGEWLELRLLAQHPEATTARVAGGLAAAREVDLLGRLTGSLEVENGAVTLALRPWEIRTLQLRR